MEAVLASLTFATAVNDAMEVWDKIERSFARVSQNRRGAQRLVCEIANDLNILKELYEDRHATLDKTRRTETAIQALIENMERTLETCTRLLPPTSEKRFKRYILKYYAWKNGGKIEEELRDLKSHVSSCYQRFTMLAMARTEIGVNEIHEVIVAVPSTIQTMLSDFNVSDYRLQAFNHRDRCGISPSIITGIPDAYLGIQLKELSDHIRCFRKLLYFIPQSFFPAIRGPCVPDLVNMGSDFMLLPHDRDVLHRDTVSLTLDIQRSLDSNFQRVSFYKILALVRKLTRMLHRLGMSRDIDYTQWQTIPVDVQVQNIQNLPRDTDADFLANYKHIENLRYLSIWRIKVVKFSVFCNKHAEILEDSEAMRDEIEQTNFWIDSIHHFSTAGPNSTFIQSATEDLCKRAKRLHTLDKRLPLLDI